ncbi:MAG: ribonuclease HII [Firmicutes bacterium]|nr:ribonuclease HII [Bacillota bacterium]
MDKYIHDKQYGNLVAGVDEAGRGPLAGPVVCAVCIMGDRFVDGVDDSKKLSASKRLSMYNLIVSNAIEYKIGYVDNIEIDRINILNATKKCMTDVINQLTLRPSVVLIDYVKLNINNSVSITRGDSLSYNIAAASILAKVTRDSIMEEYALKYPQYGFEKHKGYPTKMHYEKINKYGIADIHRKSFLKNYVNLQSNKQ